MLDLHNSLLVDSISGASGFEQRNDSLILFLEQAAALDELLTVTIHYRGIPELAGGLKGMRYEPTVATFL